MSLPASAHQSLGGVSIPERTLEHDLEVSKRYQSFSGELLRLALLGIAAIGFLLAEIVMKSAGSAAAVSPTFKVLTSISLFCFGLAAGDEI